MANRTDPRARTVHGTNPQNLVEKILRAKIYQNIYWKEQCFGLTAETLVDKAMDLDHFGGTFGGNRKPTPFMCLILKMLQIQPEKEIVVEFIKNSDYKYVRLLGAFYLRLVGKPMDVYQYLEPLYNDYRKVRRKLESGMFVLSHVDEFIEELLTLDSSCDIALPRIPRRWTLEAAGQLELRKSGLDYDEMEEEEEEEEEEPEPVADKLSRSFTQLKTSFSKIDKCEDPSRQSQLLEDVTPKLRECRRLIQEFERDMKDQEAKNSPEVNKLLQEKKRTLVKDLNAFVTLKKTYQSAIQEGQKVKLSEDGRTAEVVGAPRLASAMTNAQLMEEGDRVMGQMDQSVLRSKQVVENTINIGAATATTLKGQTEQMERIVDKLDNLEFSLKRTTKLVKALGRQMATDTWQCWRLLFLE
ncbi:unnamed protein product [Closterium sp. Naga37s-1]|nr:unnamed protein product [Closterium sp. Naga37s-1]